MIGWGLPQLVPLLQSDAPSSCLWRLRAAARSLHEMNAEIGTWKEALNPKEAHGANPGRLAGAETTQSARLHHYQHESWMLLLCVLSLTVLLNCIARHMLALRVAPSRRLT
jgi:hypothetical protein